MSFTIAVAGKGGTGKTTLCGLLIDWMIHAGRSPILAVDADANSNLNEVLGVKVDATLGEIREEIAASELAKDSPIPSSMSKQDYMEFRFNSALIEEDDFDMLVMGRSQGKGCYCFVNGLLQSQLRKFSGGYKYIVVDNEAGMEHISRGLLPSVDVMLLVSDCSRRGIQAVGRIADLVRELDLKPSKMMLIVNRAPSSELAPGILEEIENQGLELLGVVPQDQNIYDFDCAGKPTIKLPEDSPARLAFNQLAEKIFI
ncbi:MAG: AAA family ATPase [Oscillospiraceae bacterium]|nr:AAA family ATPase [Oscillospiraceae bacterium]